jgi:peptide/nickel transport system substrate-binding protein
MNAPFTDQPRSRRAILTWGGTSALLSMSLSACSFLSTEPQLQENSDQGRSDSIDVLESPALAALVEAGDLPPLEERIPAQPLVVDAPQPGSYGGTFKSPTIGPGDSEPFARLIDYEPLLRMNPMVTEVTPNVCTAVDTNDAGTEFTVTLREGMRWSDGAPFTAEDIVFAIDDVFGNEEISPVPPTWLSQDGELANAQQVDATTVKIIFSRPDGMFLEASTRIMDLVRFPKHYAKQFLPKYNDKIDREAKDEGFQGWTEYWGDRLDRVVNPDLPTISAWVVKTPLGQGPRVEWQRNPYYWKTDRDGRQLPYIDNLSFEVVTDPQVILLKATDGEFDLLYRDADITPTNKPVLAGAREQSGLELVDLKPTFANTMAIQLNLANKNKAHRELYQNRDFRIGLSHAIDRKELITAVWQRQGEPWQVAPYRESAFYDEEFATQYTAFDPAAANDHLDKAGITQRDDQGFRTLPNGDRLTVTLDVVGSYAPEMPSACSMISEMWKAVGVRLKINTTDRTLFYERKLPTANLHDGGVWYPTGGYTTEIIDPRGYLPFSAESIWATPWAEWFASRGQAGEEPISAAKEQIRLYWQLQEEPSEAERDTLFRQILDIAKEQFWVIGISSLPEPYLTVKNHLKNVQGGVPHSWAYRTPAHTNPESWYFDSVK